jgi:hypothetical protein
VIHRRYRPTSDRQLSFGYVMPAIPPRNVNITYCSAIQKTLDYLFRVLLPQHPFADTHGFIRNRTRAVRKDFVFQHERGLIAVECHERIARYHIVALHEMRGSGYSEQQELEQLRKSMSFLYTPCNSDSTPDDTHSGLS